VNLVVSGTIKAAATTVRIIASLDDVRGHRVWTQEFSGMQQDLLTLEIRFSAALSRRWRSGRPARVRSRHAASDRKFLKAYDVYLKAAARCAGQQDVKNIQSPSTTTNRR